MSDEHRVAGPEEGGRIDATGYPEPLGSPESETLYDWLAGYGFARRYVGGKVVANFGREGLGYGSYLLSETAELVVGLTDSADAANRASYAHPAPNVEYREAVSPAIPYPEGHFDVVIALEELDRPEELVKEAKRVLKPDGVLIISTLDRRVLLDTSPEGEGRRRGMYVPEFRAFLEQHFRHVRLFRQGAVAGGLVFPEDGAGTGASVEGVPTSAATPFVAPEPPVTRRVLAVCSQTEVPGGGDPAEQERPYLLLDHDRRVLEDCEDRARNVDLLRDEIRRMQETEVQAFQDTYRLLFSEIAVLRARVRRSEARTRQLEGTGAHIPQIEGGSEAQYKARIQALQDHIRDIENSATWRLFEPYRRLRAMIDAARKGKKGK